MFRERERGREKARRNGSLGDREEIGMFPADETRPLHSLQLLRFPSIPLVRLQILLTSKSFIIISIKKYSFPCHGDNVASISMLPPSYHP